MLTPVLVDPDGYCHCLSPLIIEVREALIKVLPALLLLLNYVQLQPVPVQKQAIFLKTII